MVAYNFVCTENPEHLFEVPTSNNLCSICGSLLDSELKPISRHPEFKGAEDLHSVPGELTSENESISDPVSVQIEDGEGDIRPAQPAKDVESSNPIAKLEPEPEVASEVVFGDQIWMRDFLSLKTQGDGSPIFYAKSAGDWAEAKASRKAAWCYPNNDPILGERTGLLYNYYAVAHPEGLAPRGWAIPTIEDIIKLRGQGASAFVEEHLKHASHAALCHRLALGSFTEAGLRRIFWTQNHHVVYTAFAFRIHGESGRLDLVRYDKSAGFFVRCIKTAS